MKEHDITDTEDSFALYTATMEEVEAAVVDKPEPEAYEAALRRLMAVEPQWFLRPGDVTPCSASDDPDLWFSDDITSRLTAARRCAGCYVAAQCAEWATETDQEYGIWGGKLRGHIDITDLCSRGHAGRWHRRPNGRRLCLECQAENKREKAAA